MAKSAVVTASGAVKATSGGRIYVVNVTKPGTGSASWTIYDNPSAASGTILAQGDGLASMAFPLHDGNGGGAVATSGIYVALAGTTNPTVVISYE